MKPQFTFYFVDEPQFASREARHVTANQLWCYRKHPERYELKRLGLHRYQVRINPWIKNSTAAIIEL
jgi:hypothetical protein